MIEIKIKVARML